jgi:hypothetical protein
MKLIRLLVALLVVVLVGCGLIYLGFAILLHAALESLQSHPDPAPDYAAAINRFQEIQKIEGPELNPVCHSVDFPKAVQIEHDMIDPSHPNQQIQTVYPVLVSLLNAPR